MTLYKKLLEPQKNYLKEGVSPEKYKTIIGENGENLPTFHSDPAVYKSFGIAPPAEGPRDPKKEQKFQAMLDDAASRGWHIMTFYAGGGGSVPGVVPSPTRARSASRSSMEP